MSYVASPIKYYRINANNTAIATSASGASATPTEEITEPTATAGTFDTYTASPTPTVTGTATTFITDFAEGQYLYYIDTNGNYILVGQIDTIPTQTSLTLTAAAVNTPTSSSVLASAYALITNSESIYVRIPAVTAGQNLWNMPNFSSWRLGSGLNNTSVAQLQQMSVAGTPLSNLTPTPANIPFTFVTMNIFTATGTTAGVATYFSSDAQFPTYIWIRVTPKIGTSSNLSSQTLYRFTITESQPNIQAGLNTTQTTLVNAGYSFPSSASGTNTTNTN